MNISINIKYFIDSNNDSVNKDIKKILESFLPYMVDNLKIEFTKD
jgi:hypothetical protein